VAIGFDDEGVLAIRPCAKLFGKLFQRCFLVLKIHGREWGCDDANDKRVTLRGEQKWGVWHSDTYSWLQEKGGAEYDVKNQQQDDVQRGRDENESGMEGW
jgi:hypothetical protein